MAGEIQELFWLIASSWFEVLNYGGQNNGLLSFVCVCGGGGIFIDSIQII